MAGGSVSATPPVQVSGDASDRLAHWRQERESATLFAGLAALERNARRRRVYERLAGVEERHAAKFAERLAADGVPMPAFRPSRRTRWLLALARQLGTPAVLPRIARLERADARRYLRRPHPDDPWAEERDNAVRLAAFAEVETVEAAKRWLLRFRRWVLAAVGGVLFAASVATAHNAQIEGLWFGLLTGVLAGPVVHYGLGKLAVPLGVGRAWCGWACWTAAVIDQLPFRTSPGRLPGGAGRWRTAHFVASLALVAVLVLGLGYGGGAVGARAVGWFVAGNVLYTGLALGLAFALRDNRAFCKYACPVAVVLRTTTRPALVKIAGDPAACAACASRACVRQCPMDVQIPDHVLAGERIGASECVFCQQCVAVCPPDTLGWSVGLDLGGRDRLRPRPP